MFKNCCFFLLFLAVIHIPQLATAQNNPVCFGGMPEIRLWGLVQQSPAKMIEIELYRMYDNGFGEWAVKGHYYFSQDLSVRIPIEGLMQQNCVLQLAEFAQEYGVASGYLMIMPDGTGTWKSADQRTTHLLELRFR